MKPAPLIASRPRPVSLGTSLHTEGRVEHLLMAIAVLVLLGGVGLFVPRFNRWIADSMRPLHQVVEAERELARVMR